MRSKKIDELALINGCLSGNAKFHKALYDRYAPKMFSVCLRYAKNYHQAEDILQEGFIKIYKNLHKFRKEGSFEGWIRRIFVNTAIEHYRKNVPMYPITELHNTAFDRVEESCVDQLAAKDLLQLIAQLSMGYKTVFNMYVIEGFSHKEIAEKLSITEGTSKSQLARARYLLQKLVKKQNEIKEDKRYGS